MILLIKIILSIILSDRIDRINSLTKLAEESFRKEKGRLKGKWKRKNPGESFKFLIDGKEKVMLLEDF